MPRLLDDIRTADRFSMPWFVAPERQDAWASMVQSLRELLLNPDLPVLLIDNVATYYFVGSDQEHWTR